MAWIVGVSISFHQQKTGIRTTPIHGLKNGLKNSGCPWILVAFEKMSETANQTFSTA
jgi:hypothetical protein